MYVRTIVKEKVTKEEERRPSHDETAILLLLLPADTHTKRATPTYIIRPGQQT